MSAISPCVKVCRLNDDKTYCTGCGRTLTQIGDWRTYTDAERVRIMQGLASRGAATAHPDGANPDKPGKGEGE